MSKHLNRLSPDFWTINSTTCQHYNTTKGGLLIVFWGTIQDEYGKMCFTQPIQCAVKRGNPSIFYIPSICIAFGNLWKCLWVSLFLAVQRWGPPRFGQLKFHEKRVTEGEIRCNSFSRWRSFVLLFNYEEAKLSWFEIIDDGCFQK